MKLNKITKGILLSITALSLQISAQPSIAATQPTELRNYPYCEVFPNIVSEADGTLSQIAFNTLGFNLCPADQWSTITKQNVIDAYYTAYGVMPVSATLNGRRFWVLDSMIDNSTPTSPDLLTVNGMEFGYKATVTVPLGTPTAGSSPYVVNNVTRSSTWTYKKGRLVYELTDPTGNVYVMQAYSQQIDPLMTLKKLPFIGPNDHLPAGWKYKARKLEANLDLVAAGSTQVIQDYFRNSYQINPNAHVDIDETAEESVESKHH